MELDCNFLCSNWHQNSWWDEKSISQIKQLFSSESSKYICIKHYRPLRSILFRCFRLILLPCALLLRLIHLGHSYQKPSIMHFGGNVLFPSSQLYMCIKSNILYFCNSLYRIKTDDIPQYHRKRIIRSFYLISSTL